MCRQRQPRVDIFHILMCVHCLFSLSLQHLTFVSSSHRCFLTLGGGRIHSSGRDVYLLGSHALSFRVSSALPSNPNPSRLIRSGPFFFFVSRDPSSLIPGRPPYRLVVVLLLAALLSRGPSFELGVLRDPPKRPRRENGGRGENMSPPRLPPLLSSRFDFSSRARKPAARISSAAAPAWPSR